MLYSIQIATIKVIINALSYLNFLVRYAVARPIARVPNVYFFQCVLKCRAVDAILTVSES